MIGRDQIGVKPGSDLDVHWWMVGAIVVAFPKLAIELLHAQAQGDVLDVGVDGGSEEGQLNDGNDPQDSQGGPVGPGAFG